MHYALINIEYNVKAFEFDTTIFIEGLTLSSTNWVTSFWNIPGRNLSYSTYFCVFFRYSGRALLFKRVVNLTYTHIQDRVMLTGRHMVRDVMCKNCKTKLGWMYEYATEDTQKWVNLCSNNFGFFINFNRSEILIVILLISSFFFFFRYKEGRVILEQALIQESDGFMDPYASPPTTSHRNHNHYQDWMAVNVIENYTFNEIYI